LFLSLSSFSFSQYENTNGLIFVVDSGDTQRLAEAQMELQKLLEEEELLKIHLLVFANKSDSPNALTPQEVSEQLKLQEITHGTRKWHVQSTCALTGEGLLEGLDWLAAQLREDFNNKQP
jgi:ADP-ribosylation factor protein 1